MLWIIFLIKDIVLLFFFSLRLIRSYMYMCTTKLLNNTVVLRNYIQRLCNKHLIKLKWALLHVIFLQFFYWKEKKWEKKEKLCFIVLLLIKSRFTIYEAGWCIDTLMSNIQSTYPSFCTFQISTNKYYSLGLHFSLRIFIVSFENKDKIKRRIKKQVRSWLYIIVRICEKYF